jgi:iron complex outermembrane receptor protein
LTLDAYQIVLKDRIVASGSFDGFRSDATPQIRNQAILDSFTSSGIDWKIYTDSSGISFFTNGADTKTTGVDMVFSVNTEHGDMGRVDWSASANASKTTLTRVGVAPKILGGDSILDLAASSVLTDATPKFRINLGAVWTMGAWTLSARETVYGSSSFQQQGNDGAYYNNTVSTKAITDVELSNQLTKGLSLSIGAKNLFNTYPEKLNQAYIATYYNPSKGIYTNGNVTQYPLISPFGINGGYYYARATYKF